LLKFLSNIFLRKTAKAQRFNKFEKTLNVLCSEFKISASGNGLKVTSARLPFTQNSDLPGAWSHWQFCEIKNITFVVLLNKN